MFGSMLPAACIAVSLLASPAIASTNDHDDFYAGYGPVDRNVKWSYVSAGFVRDSYDPTFKYSIFQLEGFSLDGKYEINDNFYLEGSYMTSSGEVKSGGMGVLYLSDIETSQFKVGAGYKFATENYGDYYASVGLYGRDLTNKGHRLMPDEDDKGQYLTIGVKKAFSERFDIFAGGTYINLSEGTSIDGNEYESYYTLGGTVYLTKKLYVSTFHNAYDEKNEWHAMFGYAF